MKTTNIEKQWVVRRVGAIDDVHTYKDLQQIMLELDADEQIGEIKNIFISLEEDDGYKCLTFYATRLETDDEIEVRQKENERVEYRERQLLSQLKDKYE